MDAYSPTGGDTGGLRWWQQATFYQIYPLSFQDSDGDGMGDLPGIAARLEYLAWLGIGAVWLSPIHPSPMADFGYDVADFTGFDPRLGTVDDVERLIAELHVRDIKLVLDFVPNPIPRSSTRGSSRAAHRERIPNATGTSGMILRPMAARRTTG
jgi:1,4-alpha-glucan branching enzyme